MFTIGIWRNSVKLRGACGDIMLTLVGKKFADVGLLMQALFSRYVFNSPYYMTLIKCEFAKVVI